MGINTIPQYIITQPTSRNDDTLYRERDPLSEYQTSRERNLSQRSRHEKGIYIEKRKWGLDISMPIKIFFARSEGSYIGGELSYNRLYGYEINDTPETIFEQYKEVFMEQVQEYVESFTLVQ